jgi:WD40 repeat protein
VALTSNWHYAAVGGDHDAVRVFSMPNGEPVAAFDGLPGWTRSLAFAGMGRLLAVATMNNRTRVFRLPEGESVASLETPDVTVIALRGDGRLLAASCGARIDLWDVERERVVHSIGNQGRVVKRVEIGPRGKILAAWGSDGVTRVWSLPDGTLLSAFDGAEGGAAALAFNADESQLAISDRGGILRIYTLPECELLCEVSTETKAIRSLAFRPDGEAIAVAGHDHFVRLIALPEGTLLGQVEGYAGASVIQWNSLGQMLTAATEANRNVRIWFPALPPLTAEAVQRARADEIAWAQRRHLDQKLTRGQRAWLTAWGTLAMALRGAMPRKPPASEQTADPASAG